MVELSAVNRSVLGSNPSSRAKQNTLAKASVFCYITLYKEEIFMAAQFLGVVLRSTNYAQTAEFYEKLGLKFEEHQHGGPLHFRSEDIDPTFVVEIYRQSTKYQNHTIMIAVPCLETAMDAIGCFPEILGDEMRFVYVNDPDGTPVMLVERL